MKLQTDPRHVFRQQVIQSLYSKTFQHTQLPKCTSKVRLIALDILEKSNQINLIIDKYAATFTHEKMAKIDYAILQLGMYELFFKKNNPPFRVVIDEAVELAKEFGSSASPKLVNGILGKAAEKERRALGTN